MKSCPARVLVLLVPLAVLLGCTEVTGMDDSSDVGDAGDVELDTDAPSEDAQGEPDADEPADTDSPSEDADPPGDADTPGDADPPGDADTTDDAAPPQDTGPDAEPEPDADPGVQGLTVEEQALFDGLNDLRQEHGLDPVPLSYSLTVVARTHVQDLIDHGDEVLVGECNLHSWSEYGNWTSCCYTPDHEEGACMWSKPGELTNYVGSGYEISAYAQNAEMAVNSWNSSQGHREVILNEGIWDPYQWQALGVGIDGGYAHAWFGTNPDPDSF